MKRIVFLTDVTQAFGPRVERDSVQSANETTGTFCCPKFKNRSCRHTQTTYTLDLQASRMCDGVTSESQRKK